MYGFQRGSAAGRCGWHNWRFFANRRVVKVYSLLLIVMMLLRPQGLMGTRELPSPMAVVRWWKRRKGVAA